MTDHASRDNRRHDLLAAGFIAAVVLAWLWPVTVGGRLLLPADMLMVMQPWQAHAREVGFRRVQTPFLDAIQQHYPWRKFAAQQLRQGVIPLWNPYMFCGAPFVANDQSACFYPETWLFCLMAPECAFGWAALLSLIMGGGFMYAFLRVLGLRPVAAVAGSIPFVMSGFIVGWVLLPTVRAVPMWLPLMLLAYELAVRRRSVGWAATCGLAVGMQFLAGHLHVSLLILTIFGGYVVFRLVQEMTAGKVQGGEPDQSAQRTTATVGDGERGRVDSGLARAGRAAGYAVLALASGAMLGALQLLPVMELVGMNPRKTGQGFAALAANRMMPVQLLAGLMPDLFGNPVDYSFWGYLLSPTHREYVETVWYGGIVTLLLVGTALAWKRTRTAQTWFWAGVWLTGIGMAWGTPLYWVACTLLPPLRQLPGVSRSVFLCCFAAAVLAGYGAEALARQAQCGEGGQVKRVASLLGLGLAVVALAGGLGVWLYTGSLEQGLPGIGQYTLWQMGRCLVLVAAGAAAMVAIAWRPKIGWGVTLGIMAIDLLYFAGHFTPEVPRHYLHVQTEVSDLLQRDGSVFRMTSLTGNRPTGIDRMPPNTTMAFGLQDVQGSDSLVFEGYTKLWAQVPQDDKGNPAPTSPVLDLVGCKYLVTSLDLAGVPGWRNLTDYECNVYENTEVLPRAFAVSDPAGPLRRETVRPLRITRYEPNRVVIEGPLPAEGSAVLADTCYPGWRVYVDGRERPIEVVAGLLRGVRGPGHEAQFVYYPGSFAVGAFISCLAVMLLAGLWTVARKW